MSGLTIIINGITEEKKRELGKTIDFVTDKFAFGLHDAWSRESSAVN